MKTLVRTWKATGERVYVSAKLAWGVAYYSMDDGESWHRSKRAAYEAAKDAGKLRKVEDRHENPG